MLEEELWPYLATPSDGVKALVWGFLFPQQTDVLVCDLLRLKNGSEIHLSYPVSHHQTVGKKASIPWDKLHREN